MDKYALVYEAVFDNYVNDEITLEEFNDVMTTAYVKYLNEAKVEYMDKKVLRQNSNINNITKSAQYAKLSKDINNLYHLNAKYGTNYKRAIDNLKDEVSSNDMSKLKLLQHKINNLIQKIKSSSTQHQLAYN